MMHKKAHTELQCSHICAYTNKCAKVNGRSNSQLEADCAPTQRLDDGSSHITFVRGIDGLHLLVDDR